MKDKLKIYDVVITETLQRECEIEANSEEEALEILEEKYNDCEIVLDYSDLVDTEFSNCKYTKKEINVMNEIHNFCKKECSEGVNNCAEDTCPLYRIEKIIEQGYYE